MPELETEYKSGYVAVVGRPNVGKSTLLNVILDQKVAAVSSKPQTTRKRQLGILTRKDAQVIFIDTPGMHKPAHKLGEFMNSEARLALEDADVILFIVDASEAPTEEDVLLAAQIRALQPAPALVTVLNKTDLLDADKLAAAREAFAALLPDAVQQPVSAVRRRNLDDLLAVVIARLPVGPAYFDEGQVTDLYERDIAADLVREACLRFLRDEVPHSITVRIDEFKERATTGAFIAATIFVERESQKGIVIGEGGSMLKKIGSVARQEIEAMSGRKVFLEVRVKVNRNWRDDPQLLKSLGFFREQDEE